MHLVSLHSQCGLVETTDICQNRVCIYSVNLAISSTISMPASIDEQIAMTHSLVMYPYTAHAMHPTVRQEMVRMSKSCVFRNHTDCTSCGRHTLCTTFLFFWLLRYIYLILFNAINYEFNKPFRILLRW